MDDIFSGSNEEEDLKEDSNIEWKKSGIDKNERITLKVNVKEANDYNAKKKRDTQKKLKADKSLAPQGFKKIKKKIRGPLDEDEDEDEFILVPVFLEFEESSLLKVLTPDEKKLLNQRDNMENIRLQENIGKQAAIAQAERAVKNIGMQLDKKVVTQKMTKEGKLEAKEVLEESLKKRKPLTRQQKDNIDKAKNSKEAQKIKAKTAEERALEQAARKAEKKNQLKDQKRETIDNKDGQTKSEAKQQEAAKAAEELKIKEQEQIREQENLKQEIIQKEEKTKDEESKEILKTTEEKQKEEKSAKELIMEKRGQKTAQSQQAADVSGRDERVQSEEERKRQLEEQFIQRYQKER